MSIVQKLINKGVYIPSPESVDIGGEVDPDRISANETAIYAGCKIYGESTLICRGARIGYEAPVTLENCQVGPNVQLRGGYLKEAVFLEGAVMGSGAQVREGTIIEEQAGGAHTVGLKQTILFPFVTLGSLINFCDILMAGGTDRKNHSEVGSSYIHFNFTPNQDKATASLLGDVPRGVMLKQRPIFLGGQGGLVGPCRLSYGITIAAGTIHRKDELRPDRLLFGGAGKGGNIPYTPGGLQNEKRIVVNNLVYIANLYALNRWYANVRSRFVSTDVFPESLLKGLRNQLAAAIDERLKRLGEFCGKLARLRDSDVNQDPKTQTALQLANQWKALEDWLRDQRGFSGDPSLQDPFMDAVEKGIKDHGKQYLSVIQGLDSGDADTGTRWLQSIVDGMVSGAGGFLPYAKITS